jgi:hypothetical protein
MQADMQQQCSNRFFGTILQTREHPSDETKKNTKRRKIQVYNARPQEKSVSKIETFCS